MSVFLFEEAGGGGGCTNNNERKTNSQGSNRKNKIPNKKSAEVDSGAASLCSSEISVSSKVSRKELIHKNTKNTIINTK